MDSPGSELPLALLKDGALMCTSAQDVLDAMQWSGNGRQMSLFDAPNEKKSLKKGIPDPILEAVEREEQTFEELLAVTGLDASELSARLTILEIEGKIRRLGGRAYGRAD